MDFNKLRRSIIDTELSKFMFRSRYKGESVQQYVAEMDKARRAASKKAGIVADRKINAMKVKLAKEKAKKSPPKRRGKK